MSTDLYGPGAPPIASFSVTHSQARSYPRVRVYRLRRAHHGRSNGWRRLAPAHHAEQGPLPAGRPEQPELVFPLDPVPVSGAAPESTVPAPVGTVQVTLDEELALRVDEALTICRLLSEDQRAMLGARLMAGRQPPVTLSSADLARWRAVVCIQLCAEALAAALGEAVRWPWAKGLTWRA